MNTWYRIDFNWESIIRLSQDVPQNIWHYIYIESSPSKVQNKKKNSFRRLKDHKQM